MQIAEFEEWLKKGLGRAVVRMTVQDSNRFRDSLLYACTHNLAFDRQCESSREVYLADLIEATGDTSFYRNELVRLLSAKTIDIDEVDFDQLIALARTFVEKGDSELKAVMYEAVRSVGFEQAGTCYEDLIALDGVKALVEASQSFSSTTEDDDLWVVDALVTAAEEYYGPEKSNIVQDAARENPKLSRMIEIAKQWRERFEATNTTQSRPDYPTIRTTIHTNGAKPGLYGWGKTASEQELLAAADDLLCENDMDALLGYLRIFRWRRFPRSIEKLLTLANSADVRVNRASINVLSQISDSRIRELALRLLDIPARRGDAIELMISNFEDSDFKRIEQAVGDTIEEDDLHGIGMAVRHLFDAHRAPEAETTLLDLYDRGPCSLCRGGFVENLIALRRLPAWMRVECQFDSDLDTRKAVSNVSS